MMQPLTTGERELELEVEVELDNGTPKQQYKVEVVDEFELPNRDVKAANDTKLLPKMLTCVA